MPTNKIAGIIQKKSNFGYQFGQSTRTC